ncbi:MAG TPA: CpXC domain-containing protein [Ktedonobacteraceae bacterium]|nr:CpXC domain-containing protein [Ktedonobacteraceae bacterium]
MSRSTTHNFNCPCGKAFEHTIYDYVNITREPRLRYVVLAGLLNVATCPNCGRKAAIGRPFIYSDPEHQLLAYVHPRNDAPEEARLMILEQLRTVYETIVSDNESPEGGTDKSMTEASAEQIMATPPLQVVFGNDQLHELINATLNQDERLGKLALSTRSHAEAERGQMLDIARKLASEMGCQIEVEDLADEYTVWIFGPRRQIGALMRELATH